MQIFITGSSGFIGSRFLEKLKGKLKSDDRIYLLLRKDADFSDKRIKVLKGDLGELQKFEKEICGCDYAFHIAANATFGDNEDYENTNFLPTKNLVDILQKSKRLKNFVFISTIGAVDRHKHDDCKGPLNTSSIPAPKSKYGESKLKSESYIRSSGIPFTIIRPTWVYGRNMRQKSHINLFVTMICQGSIATKIDFPGRVSLIHVDDLAISLINCIGNENVKGKIYFAETESISLGEIFGTIKSKVAAKGIIVKDSKLVPIPSFKYVMRKIHRFLPVTLNNLFIDYLYAQDPKFHEDLLYDRRTRTQLKTIRFEEGVDDVISTNILACGYWVITGANSGIGLALARILKQKGKRLILIDKDIEVLNSEFGPKDKDDKDTVILKCDLSESKNIMAISEVIKRHPIFCLVNNAGIGYRKSFDKIGLDEIEKIIAVNIKSHIYLTKLLLDKMKKEQSIIVNIASSVAYNPLPNMLMYSSTKAFISNWSESLTYELKDTNKVITFSPSGTNTKFQENSGVKKTDDGKGLLTPQEVANEIVNAVQKNKTVVILGFKTKILLIASNILPRKLNILLWGKLFEKMR